MHAKWAGWVISAAGLMVFVGLGWQVHTKDSAVSRFDEEVASAAQQHAKEHPRLLELARETTDAGGVPVMTALAIVGCLLLWLCGQQQLAACWLLAAALGCVVNISSKGLFDRPRPDATLRDDAVHERNASYPSGHAMGSVIGYGSLAYVAVVLLRRRSAKVAMVTLPAVLVLLIGLSRIYLRAHWSSDVIGGFAIGICWLSLCITALSALKSSSLH
jgi:undecaprenyl-diphosphatase